jgi:hypothetical protein
VDNLKNIPQQRTVLGEAASYITSGSALEKQIAAKRRKLDAPSLPRRPTGADTQDFVKKFGNG